MTNTRTISTTEEMYFELVRNPEGYLCLENYMSDSLGEEYPPAMYRSEWKIEEDAKSFSDSERGDLVMAAMGIVASHYTKTRELPKRVQVRGRSTKDMTVLFRTD